MKKKLKADSIIAHVNKKNMVISRGTFEKHGYSHLFQVVT